MRQFSAAQWVAALLALFVLVSIAGCGGGNVQAPVATSITLRPSTLSLNEGQVLALTATAMNAQGSVIAVDFTFTSSNPALASVTSAGLVCGGQFDTNNIVCTPNGDGQVNITVQSGVASAISTVYVHKQVDRVEIQPVNGCESMGSVLNPVAAAYNTSAPGCSVTAPCDITSTVGPFVFGSGNATVVASAAGINPTFNPQTKSPTYVSGGTITGSAGQTCNLSSFNGVTNATATVTLSDTNAIATGTRLTITNSGVGGGSTAPTTATLSNGTATCSGTATVITRLQTTVGVDPVIGATATVALTADNAIATGTQLTVTNSGFGAVQPPTTATLSNGTATCTGTASVLTTLNQTTGLEAQNPGTTALFASVAGVNSVGTPFIVCPVQSIAIHDATSSNTNFTLTGGQTQNLVADVLDSMGASIKPNLTWANSQAGVGGLAADSANASFAASGPGTTSLTATCITPTCNVGLAPQYSYNVATVAVSGQSPDTVFAASTKSLMLVPIPAITNVPGTAITLPHLPNSIVASADGTHVYLGSDSGVMVYNTSSNTLSTVALNGKVLAVSENGGLVLISNAAANATYLYSTTQAAVLATAVGPATAGTLTPDNNWSLSLIGQNLVRQGNSVPITTTALSATPAYIDVLAQGSLAYITSTTGKSVDVRSTCDQSDLQTLSANNPTFVARIPKGTGAVVVDSPNIDVITTVQPTGACPTVASSTIAAYDQNVGAFNPTQLIVSYDSTHAWVLTDTSAVLTMDLTLNTTASIPLAGGAIAYNGGLTLDSSQLYVGATDGNVHRIAVSTLSDAQQIAPGLKDANSVPVNPDLVAVLPK